MNEIGEAFLGNVVSFSWEILKILPPVLVLMALLDAWVSRTFIESHLGKKSGLKGAVLAVFLGTTAAGPLFAAFPVAISMRNKGARTANLVIFLGAWSTIKIPMLILESNFLGMRFALWRFLITVPLLIVMGHVMEKIIGPYDNRLKTEA